MISMDQDTLAQYTAVYTRSWMADSTNPRLRDRAELNQANQEIALLREQMRIKDARMASIPPQRRPHYPPTDLDAHRFNPNYQRTP